MLSENLRFTIVSKSNISKINQIFNDLRNSGLDIHLDDNNPDFVITYGGDGTIIDAERLFPGIPKITVRESEGGFKCFYKESDLKNIILNLLEGKYKLKEESKLDAEFNGKKYKCLNEFQLHNANPTQAVRFSVFVDDKPVYWNVIGDGVVVATPFGSTAYFASLRGLKFSRGIGIALNNPFKYEFDPNRLFCKNRKDLFDENSIVKIKANRDGGILLFDNDPMIITIKEGDEIIIKKSLETAKFVILI